MKKTVRLISVLFIFLLCGCASAQRNKYYADLAKEHDFGYYFPEFYSNRTFSTIEEAYDFVNTAQVKFASSVKKSAAKGLAAKLIGPPVENDEPVSIECFISAGNEKSGIALWAINESLETVLKNAISATVIFLVFYQNRGVSISRFYLAQGYAYTSNSLPDNFNYQGYSYKADYPVGWGIEKAFDYLKKEIN